MGAVVDPLRPSGRGERRIHEMRPGLADDQDFPGSSVASVEHANLCAEPAIGIENPRRREDMGVMVAGVSSRPRSMNCHIDKDAIPVGKGLTEGKGQGGTIP